MIKKKILIYLLNYYIKMNGYHWTIGYNEYLERIKFSEPLSETIQSEKILEKQNKIKIIILDLIPYDYLLNVFKKWTIIIDLNKDNKDKIFPEIKYGLENKADK